MVCRITLRVIICAMSCALEAHMFVFRRTSKHNQPPHMGLSSAAPCQAAWPFSVTLRRSSVHRKAKSWAKRRCAQETTPPPSASHTHERTSSPLFRQKTSFLFLRTTLAHLPAPVDYVRPTQTHKPTRPSNKPKIDPTPGNPQTSGVTKLRPRMTPHSRSNHTYARTHERTSNPLSRRFLETPSRPVLSTAVPAPTGIRPRHKIFSQSTISPTTKKLHQTKIELLCDVTKPRFRHMASLHMLIHTHTLNQLQNKMGIKPTPGNPPEHDATQLRLYMTPHPFLHTRV